MPIRIPIGEFARSCRLTVKALRHYDELGLLTPEHVDRKTSYRYYTHEQAKTAIVIAMLRDLDVPLPTIRAVLAAKDPESVAGALRDERIRIERSIRRAHTALASLDHVMARGVLVAPDVVLRDEPAHDTYRVEGTTTGETHVVDTTLLVETLCARLRDAGVTFGDPILAVLPKGLTDEPFPIEVCAASTSRVYVEGLSMRAFPEMRCAAVRHVGPYETLGLAHHAVHGFAASRGLTPSGPIREVYVSDPAQTEPKDLVTEVLLPVG